MENDRVFELLARVERGDEAAFSELHKAFGRRLYAYALRQLSDAAQAEEIVSDTMYEVWRRPGLFRGEAQFGTWLIGIARHKVLMAWRARRPDRRHEDIDELADTLPSEEAGAFDLLAQRQRREGVEHCLERLSDEHRECVHLVFYEGLSLAEVAGVQGCPENTVKTRLFHARQKLRNCLRLLLEREGEPAPAEAAPARGAPLRGAPR